MAKEKTVGFVVTTEEYEALQQLRIQDGKIRTVSEVLRSIVIPIIMDGNETHIETNIETKDDKHIDSPEPVSELIDSIPDFNVKKEDPPNFFKDLKV